MSPPQTPADEEKDPVSESLAALEAEEIDERIGVAPLAEGHSPRASGGVRHRAREVALQVLFALDLQTNPGRNRSQKGRPEIAHVFEEVAAHFEMPEGIRSFALELCAGAIDECAELDRAIEVHARNWRLERMAVVDRNVMRLATWELLRTDTPAAVVIDEAVEMSRRFGADQSPAFVNGILDAVAQSVRGRAAG